MPRVEKPTPEMIELMHKAAADNVSEAMPYLYELAEALQNPLRQGVLVGDNLGDIYDEVPFSPGQETRMPLDFLAPGTESEYVAYTISSHGHVPEKSVEGDYVIIPTYEVGAAIDATRRYLRDARWDVMGRMMQVLQVMFTKKRNDDGWHTSLAAGVDRNIMVYDSDAPAGMFTKRLISLMKVIMRRNGGGNSTSVNRGRLTDVYISPEGIEDIRNWNTDQLDDASRGRIFTAPDGSFSEIFGVRLRDMDELGEGQEYQTFFTNQLSGNLATGDVELIVGLNLDPTLKSFVSPVVEDVKIFPDETMARQRRVGWYGFREHGFAVLDNRNVLLGSF